MKRQLVTPRDNWQAIVEAQGMTFHHTRDRIYWDESACYVFSSSEITALEEAVAQLDAMCLKAVEHVISRGLWEQFQIPVHLRQWVTRSWEREERTIYGRYDLRFDGQSIKMLEFNADTPTGLIEAAVAQWFWLEQKFPGCDQWNSIHERLIEAFAALKADTGFSTLHVSSIDDGDEDFLTANYLRDTAHQAGFQTVYLPIHRVGWHAKRRVFTDESERAIDLIFKLYPWEWLAREEFGVNLTNAPTRWVEAPWKMILSNKAILVVLWELFPDHPLLLRAAFEPWSRTYAQKPLLGREGANTRLVRDGSEIVAAGGRYSGPYVYQELAPLPSFDGHYPVCGAWLVNGWPCGLGIREEDQLITTNQSRFVPHRIQD